MYERELTTLKSTAPNRTVFHTSLNRSCLVSTFFALLKVWSTESWNKLIFRVVILHFSTLKDSNVVGLNRIVWPGCKSIDLETYAGSGTGSEWLCRKKMSCWNSDCVLLGWIPDYGSYCQAGSLLYVMIWLNTSWSRMLLLCFGPSRSIVS